MLLLLFITVVLVVVFVTCVLGGVAAASVVAIFHLCPTAADSIVGFTRDFSFSRLLVKFHV